MSMLIQHLSRQLLERNTQSLRITLSAGHSVEDVERPLAALARTE